MIHLFVTAFVFISLINIFLILINCGSKKPEKETEETKTAKEVQTSKSLSSPKTLSSPKSDDKPSPTAKVTTKSTSDESKPISNLESRGRNKNESLSDHYEDPRKVWAMEIVKQKCSDLVENFREKLLEGLDDEKGSCKAFNSNESLNRYPEIKCLDKNRVIIKNNGNDYIHASLIRTHHTRREYILTQGGVDQCAQYYPEGEREKEKYGDYEVTLVKKEEEPVEGVCWNVLEVEDLNKSNSKIEINHILVPWWPNKFAPNDPRLTVELFRWLRKRNPAHVPIVVHCNNGIGRSAAFVAIDYLACHILFPDQETGSDVQSGIIKLRKERSRALEAEMQYLFLHACLLEYLVQVGGIIRRDVIRPFLNDYKEYAQMKMDERKAEKMKKQSEPEKPKPVEVKPLPPPSPSKPEGLSPKPLVHQNFPPAVEPVKEKSKKESEKTHESSKKLNTKRRYPEITWVDSNMHPKCAEIVEEYRKHFSKLQNDKCPPCKEFDAHPDLNRYKDIKCLDKSRVIIKNGKSDYIHASWVQIPEHERKYILAQSPMSNTVDDFWQMLVENEVKYIVMLCPYVEGGEEQSCQYFPEGEGEKLKYGNVEVELAKTKPHPIDGVIWSVLNVEDLKKNCRTEINHILVPWWPDKCAPEDPELTAKLVWWLKKRINPDSSPMVVHCNNGIGRSATFVAISLLRYHLLNEKREDDFRSVEELIYLLREMRYGAIENEEMYLFLYACILKYFSFLSDGYENEYVSNKTRILPFLNEYKAYMRKKMEVRKAEMRKEKSLKVEPTKEDYCSKEEVKQTKSQMSEAKKEKSSKSKEKPNGNVEV